VLLEKNRHKRPNLEKVLAMEWFSDYAEANEARKDADKTSQFKAYTLTTPDSPKIQQEIDEVLST
jgi:hypothetical protein